MGTRVGTDATSNSADSAYVDVVRRTHPCGSFAIKTGSCDLASIGELSNEWFTSALGRGMNDQVVGM